MLLGSVAAKVLNTRDFQVGAEVKMSRVTYVIQPDGSVRRHPPKRRNRTGVKFSPTDLVLTPDGYKELGRLAL